MAPKQRNVVGSSSSSSVRVNPIVTNYCQRIARSKVTYKLQPESKENLKFSKLRKEEKHAYREHLSKLQVRTIVVPRLINWDLFAEYECENQLRDMMKMSYVYPGDGDTFKDFSWERAFSIYENVYREWSLEFFSTFYFERKVVDLMRETCVWFRLCGNEHAYTLSGFTVALGLYEQHEIEHRLFEAHFVSLVRYHNDYDGIPAYWNRFGDPGCSRRNSSKLRNPLMKVLQKLIAWGVLHRTGSRDKCNQPELWVMKLLEEDKNGNAAWIIAEYLSRRAPGIKDKSEICGGHYVAMLARNLGYFEDEELVKCSGPIESETWDDKSFGKAMDRRNRTLGAWTKPKIVAPQPPPPMGNVHGNVPGSFNSGWGDWNRELNDIERREVWRDSMMMRNNYNYDYSMPMLQHLAREANYAIPPYNRPNVPPYSFPYDPYPGPYPYPYPGYAPFPEPVLVYGRVPEVGGSSFDVGGSSRVGKKKRRAYSVFEEDENYETEGDEESEDERIHTPDNMDDDDE